MECQITIKVMQDEDATVAKATVYHNDRFPLTDTSATGSAKRAPQDAHNPNYGRNLAVTRALLKLGVLGECEEYNVSDTP